MAIVLQETFLDNFKIKISEIKSFDVDDIEKEVCDIIQWIYEEQTFQKFSEGYFSFNSYMLYLILSLSYVNKQIVDEDNFWRIGYPIAIKYHFNWDKIHKSFLGDLENLKIK